MVNCPLKTADYSGACEYCNERTNCMLQEILQRLHELEEAVAVKKM